MIARDLINYSFTFAISVTAYCKELVGFFFLNDVEFFKQLLKVSFLVQSYLACIGKGQHFNSNSQFSSCTTETSSFSYFLFVSLSCAGVCRYEGKGGMCSIRLSEPLLKLRPRKDLVEVFEDCS